MVWDYSGRKGRDEQKKKIGKANKKRKRGKVKKAKDEKVNGQGRKRKERGYPAPRLSALSCRDVEMQASHYVKSAVFRDESTVNL